MKTLWHLSLFYWFLPVILINVLSSSRERYNGVEGYLTDLNACMILYTMLVTTILAVVGIELHEIKRKLWECYEQREQKP
ncbi:MAG: hypothetical protein F7B59_03050 [Desulfurococcales archaeon]|nr:hypothetical protein [Desulfurococcales archaeon]